MFNKNIDVAEIMKDIQQKAIKKSNEEPYPIALDTSDPLLKRLQLISAQLAQVNESIINTYNYTKEHEDTALRLHVSHIRPVLLRKVITFVRRLIRKSTNFIWIEQNEVNKSLNANINALHNTQLVMANNLHVMRDLHESIIGIHNIINEINNKINENHNKINENQYEFKNSIEAIKEEQIRSRDYALQLRKSVNEKYETSPQIEIGKEQMRDQMYLWLEDEFRGSREEIKRRQSYYIESYIIPHIRDKDNDYVLDIGCGRGEWLELLKENGVRAKGVDISPDMVKLCLDLGLDVIQIDAFEYLKSLPDESVKIITGFHIVEHLPFHIIEAYLFECYRVLQSHGMVIFETPNAANLRVGSYNFYLDPSHNRPIHDKAIDFLARCVGFYDTKIVYPLEADASKYWESITKNDEIDGSLLPEARAVMEIVKKNLYCSEDYALIAVK